MKITVETAVKAPLDPSGAPGATRTRSSAGTPRQTNGTRRGAASTCAKAAAFTHAWKRRTAAPGFDFEGTYTRVVPQKMIDFRMDDGRKVNIEFIERPEDVVVKETFDAETESTLAMQRLGWQAILDNFGQHVEARFKGANGLADKM
jgi:uncharacterized protein YndB with AHSA1/START domain